MQDQFSTSEIFGETMNFEEYKQQKATTVIPKKKVQISSQESSHVEEMKVQRSLTQTNFQQKGILKYQSPSPNSTQRNSLAQRRTNTVAERSANDEKVLSQYIKIKLKEDESIKFADLKTPEAYEKFLTTLLYRDVRLVGRGTTTVTYKAINISNQIVAVKVQHKSEGGLQAALLYKSINQDIANNLQGHSLFQHQIIEVEDILVIEEDLANETLEDVLLKRSQKGQNFSWDEIRTITVDIVEQLYLLQVIKGCVHNDIKPENILVKGGRYILHDLGVAEQGDYAGILAANHTKPITDIIGTPLYMSPAKLDHYLYCLHNNLLSQAEDVFESYVSKQPLPQITYNHKNLIKEPLENFVHNQFKSDIYSFGLVLLRLLLHNNNVTLTVQIENLFYHDRVRMYAEAKKYPYYFHHERFIFYEGSLRIIRPVIDLMLEENEEKRVNILELALMLNTSQNILRSILTPHAKTFPPIIEHRQDYLRVIYDVKKLIYEGEYDEETQERTGIGIMFQTEESYWNKSKYQPQPLLAQVTKKNQTIKEEELSFELSQLDYKAGVSQPQSSGLQDRKTFISRLKEHSFMDCQEKIIFYEGQWYKNYPHGPGDLKIYSTKLSQGQYETQRGIKHKGTLIKQKSSSGQLNLGLTISSDFFLGMLNGITIIQIEEEIIRKNFVLNMSSSVLAQASISKLGFGVYTMIQDPLSQTVMGYFEAEILYVEKRTFTFDLKDLQLNKIEEVLKSLFLTISFKVERIIYVQDRIKGVGVLNLHGIYQMLETQIVLLFAESLAAKRPRSRQSQFPLMVAPVVKKKGCFGSLCCCFQKKKRPLSSSKVLEDSNNTVPELQDIQEKLENENVLSLIMFCVLSNLSLQSLDYLNLSHGSLKRASLQHLENLSQFTKLSHLNLERCFLQDITQLDNILVSQTSTYLKVLNLNGLKVADSTIDAIINSENLNQLQKLYLNSSLLRLLNSDKMRKITTLDLSRTLAMDGKLLLHLNADQFVSLREFSISGCPNITIETLNKFIKSEFVRKLWCFNCEDLVQTAKNKPVPVQIADVNQMQNLRELSLYNLRALDVAQLELFKDLSGKRLKSLNLVFAFKEIYAIHLGDVLRYLAPNETLAQLSFSYRLSNESRQGTILGKSSFGDFNLDVPRKTNDISDNDHQEDNLSTMDRFLIDLFIEQIDLPVQVDIPKIQTQRLINSTDLINEEVKQQMREVEVVDCGHHRELDASFLSHLILLFSSSTVKSLYFVVTKESSQKVIQLLQDLSNAIHVRLKKITLNFEKVGPELYLIHAFLIQFTAIYPIMQQLNMLEIRSQMMLPQHILALMSTLRCLNKLTLNDHFIELSNDSWEGSSFGINSNQFLRHKIDILMENKNITVEHLYLSNIDINENQGQIKDETLRQLAEADGLQQLDRLILSHQHLLTDQGIEYVLKSHNTNLVQIIDLSHTNISGEVFQLITGSTHLQNLRQLILLECHQVAYEPFAKFIDTVPAQSLKSFEITSKQINTVDQFFMLKKLKRLEKIKIVFLHAFEEKLSESTLSSKDSILMLDQETMRALYCLHLDFSKVHCTKIQRILNVLKNPNLEMVLLDLSRHGEIDQIIRNGFNFLSGLRQGLQEFSLNLTGTTFIVDEELTNSMRDFFNKNDSLQYLQLTWNRVVDGSNKLIEQDNLFVQQMVQSIARLRHLHSLDLSFEKQSTFSRNTMQIMSKELKQLSTLQIFKLSLTGCVNFDSQDFDVIAKMVHSWPELQKIGLHLAYTNLNDESLQVMLELFLKNEIQLGSIRKITLNLEGCQKVAKAFQWFLKQQQRKLSASKDPSIRRGCVLHLNLRRTNVSQIDKQKLQLVKNLIVLD